MSIYKVTMPDGSDNLIVAEAAFVREYYPGAELMPDPPAPPPPEPDPDAALKNAAGELLLGMTEALK